MHRRQPWPYQAGHCQQLGTSNACHQPFPNPQQSCQVDISGGAGGVKANLSEADLAKLVVKTDGYSGSDMKNLIQEACQGPVRDAVAQHGSAIAKISEKDLRPVLLKDFQVWLYSLAGVPHCNGCQALKSIVLPTLTNA